MEGYLATVRVNHGFRKETEFPFYFAKNREAYWKQVTTGRNALSHLPREHVAAGDTVRDHHLLQDLRGARSSYATAFSLGSGPRTMLMNPYS